MAMSNNFEKNIQQQLNISLTTLDASTQSQLAQSRNKALTNIKKSRFNIGQWFTGFATAATLALLVITVMPSSDNTLISSSPDWVLMSDIELYQDLDFYQWLDETEESNG